jgi:hypothetical protein
VTKLRAGQTGVRISVGERGSSTLNPSRKARMSTQHFVIKLQQSEGDTYYSYLVLSLRMSGAIPPFSLYSFMMCIGKDLFYLSRIHLNLSILNVRKEQNL